MITTASVLALASSPRAVGRGMMNGATDPAHNGPTSEHDTAFVCGVGRVSRSGSSSPRPRLFASAIANAHPYSALGETCPGSSLGNTPYPHARSVAANVRTIPRCRP